MERIKEKLKKTIFNKKYYHLTKYSICFTLIGTLKIIVNYIRNKIKIVRLLALNSVSSKSTHIEKILRENKSLISNFSLINGQFVCNTFYNNSFYVYSIVKMSNFDSNYRIYANNFTPINYRIFTFERLSFLSEIVYSFINSLLKSNKDGINTSIPVEEFLAENDQVIVLEKKISSNKYYADYICQGNSIALIENLKSKLQSVQYMHDFCLYFTLFTLFSDMCHSLYNKIIKIKTNKSYLKYTSESIPNSIYQKTKCVKCKSSFKAILNLKCGHFALCYKCFNDNNNSCPICSSDGYDYIFYN